PDFMVLTGNDLAIDMVMWGSDYLLGLSTFAPAEFALRDRLWLTGDPAFHELNDLLQYLGQFTFRPPVPGYRHDAAMFFQLRGWASSDMTPTGAARRPEGDREVLADIVRRLESWA
ncbi:MAG: dihydrodipicolinate synthase family protein, partial [Actinobacteria bacterium]|nr:dihydrodipicolinate synthase family protein [Actinomycetota bacterium]